VKGVWWMGDWRHGSLISGITGEKELNLKSESNPSFPKSHQEDKDTWWMGHLDSNEGENFQKRVFQQIGDKIFVLTDQQLKDINATQQAIIQLSFLKIFKHYPTCFRLFDIAAFQQEYFEISIVKKP
jgi:hypothetical protein